MKLTVNLVTWNGEKYIPFLFESLRKQSFKNWKLVIFDNGSTDKTVEKIEKEIKNFPVEIDFTKGKENLGFAVGHNKLSSEFGVHGSEYILLLNQDMYLEKDCLEKLVKFMDENKESAVVSPRLMRWDFVNKEFTNKIDTLGLKASRSRRVTEWMTGLEWSNKLINQLTSKQSVGVFGVSGALPMFRKSVIDKVGLFDESFGSYKEDVDLAFRLRSAGHKAFVLLDAVAYHDRTAAGTEKMSIKNKREQPQFVRHYSYRNHLLLLLKNEYWQNFLLDILHIKWYELKKFMWFLLFDRSVLKGLSEIWNSRKKLKTERLKIKKLRKISWREMRRWFK